MRLHRNIKILYLMGFFRSLIFAYVIERLFGVERGMTVQMFVYCEIIYALAVSLLEVPSGILADRFGRKTLLIVGAVCSCLEFGLLINAEGFPMFGLSALLAGIGGACTSGTENAMLYDSLIACGRQDEFEKILGRVKTFESAALLISALSGAALGAGFGFSFNYVLSSISCLIALAAGFALSEPDRSGEGDKPVSAVEITKAALGLFRKRADVLRIVIHGAVIASCFTYLDEFSPLYLNETAFPVALFGVVVALNVAAGSAASLLAERILKRVSHKTLMFISAAAISAGIAWMALQKSWLGIPAVMLINFAASLAEMAAEGYLHHNADSASRATAESMSAVIQRMLSVIIGLVFGYISTNFTIFNGFWMLSGVTALTAVYFAIRRVYERTSDRQ